MKANEFVKKFGLDKARKVLENSPSNAQAVDAKSSQYYRFNPLQITGMKGMPWNIVTSECYYNKNGHPVGLGDLKRLVESHEFINERGGLEHVKNLIATKLHWFDVDAIIKTNQAIFDVESCQ